MYPYAGSSAPFDQNVFQEIQERTAVVRNNAAPVKKRIRAIQKLHGLVGTVGFGENTQEALRAGVVDELVRVAAGEWPPDGDLRASSSIYDREVKMESSLSRRRSMRRSAWCALAEAGNYTPMQLAMATAGLFDGLEPKLHSAMQRYKFGQTLVQVERTNDQVQDVACCMLNLLANAVANPRLGARIIETYGDTICQCYNPFPEPDSATPGAGPAGMGGSGLGARAGAGSWGAAAEEEEEEGDESGSEDDGFDPTRVHGIAGMGIMSTDQVATDFCRFWANGLSWLGDAAVQDRLVEMGLVGKLRQAPGRASIAGGKDSVLALLKPAFERHAQRQIREVKQPLKQAKQEGRSHRERGNDAFKAADYEGAVGLYRQGIEHTPQDPVLYANASLALLRLGRHQDALDNAELALQFDPCRAKNWVRLGDAYRGLGRWAPCALLCYHQAARLAPGDAEVADRVRAQEAEVPADQVIGLNRLPRESDISRDPAAMGRIHRALERDPEGLDEVLRRETLRMLVERPSSSLDPASTQRGRAMKSIVPLVELVESASAAAAAPQRMSGWAVSWSDCPVLEGAPYPQRYYMVTVMDCQTATRRATVLRPGRPTAAHVLQALKLGMSHPDSPGTSPERPIRLLVAHRIRAEFKAVEEEMSKLGVRCTLETREEAEATARAHGMDPDGINFANDPEFDRPDSNSLMAGAVRAQTQWRPA